MEANRREGIYTWLFVAVLVGSTLGLAALQFRWIGQISEGQRDLLRRGLEVRLNNLARELETSIRAAMDSLTPQHGVFPEEARLAEYRQLVAQWRRQPTENRLFRRVARVLPKGSEVILQDLDLETGILQQVPWPAEWSNLRRQFEDHRRHERPSGPIRIREFDLMEVPVWERRGGAEGEQRQGQNGEEQEWLIFQFDIVLLRTILFPALERKHLNQESREDYEVRLFSRGEIPREIYRSAAGSLDRPSQSADAEVELLLGNGRQGGRGRGPKKGPGNGPGTGPGNGPGPGRWVLTAQHRTGSLENAVEQGRLQNLALTAGLMVVMLLTIAAMLRFTRKAQQLAELQMEFVAGISHELRTPLTVIRTAAYNLSSGVVRLDNQPQFQRYGNMILTQADKLTAMVEQVLRFASIQAGRVIGKRELMSIQKVIQDAVAASQVLLSEADAKLDLKITPDLPPVLGDDLALQHAIQNLISNAAKYGPRGGRILLAAKQHQQWIQVKVLDQGPGIGSGEVEAIFMPFFRGKGAIEEQIHGTGLGLSLVKRIVEAHDGTITAQNIAGAGAEFVISIPIAEGEGNEFSHSTG